MTTSEKKIPTHDLDGKGKRRNLLLLLVGLAVINAVFYGLYLVKALNPSAFFYDPLEGYAGFLYDFFNPIRYTYHLNPMEYQWSNSPPFLHFFCYLASLPLRLFTPEQGGARMAFSVAGMVGFGLLAAAMLSAIIVTIRQLTRPALRRGERGLLCAMAVLSYPVFFALSCGNLSLLVAALIALFLLAFRQGKFCVAAILLGVAAAFKLYPALLGLLFLCDKRWKEALLCAATFFGLTLLSLVMFQGGVAANLQDWLAKTSEYSRFGNLDLRRIMMDNNSLFMLWDIPHFIAAEGAVSLEGMAEHNVSFGYVLTALLALSCLSCFALRRRRDRVLLLSLWMIGYPYNSAPYNLALLLVPLVYWAQGEEKQNAPMIVMGVLLLMCKTRFALYATNVRHITVQSAMNPLLISAMILWLFWLRRKELRRWRIKANRDLY